MRPNPNEYKYFSVQLLKSADGDFYLLYYLNRRFDGGTSFCHVRNDKITSGDDWCFLIEDHIINLCKTLVTYRPYNFNEYFRGPLRDFALSKLIGYELI